MRQVELAVARGVKIRASVSLNLLDRVVDIHGGATSYVLAVLAKAITIHEKTHRMLHAKKVATHRRDRTVRIHIVCWNMSIALLTQRDVEPGPQHAR